MTWQRSNSLGIMVRWVRHGHLPIDILFSDMFENRLWRVSVQWPSRSVLNLERTTSEAGRVTATITTMATSRVSGSSVQFSPESLLHTNQHQESLLSPRLCYTEKTCKIALAPKISPSLIGSNNPGIYPIRMPDVAYGAIPGRFCPTSSELREPHLYNQ